MNEINLSGFKKVESVEKAYQEGIYSDSPANRKLGRVGMTYKQVAEKAEKDSEKSKSTFFPIHTISPDEKHRYTGGQSDNFAGNLGIKDHPRDYILQNLDSSDEEYLANKGVKLGKGEKVFRYSTKATEAGGLSPLIKINTNNGMVYFNEGDSSTEEIKFGTKGSKIFFINLMPSTMDKRIEGNRPLELYEARRDQNHSLSVGDNIIFERNSGEVSKGKIKEVTNGKRGKRMFITEDNEEVYPSDILTKEEVKSYKDDTDLASITKEEHHKKNI